MPALTLLHLGIGIALIVVGWAVPRRGAHAPIRLNPGLLLDTAPFVIGSAWGLLTTGRPLFTGVIAAALGAGFALADATMRKTLHEPVVFPEASELPQLFTHPQLYLPFAGPGMVLGGTGAVVAVALGLLIFEPPVWTPRPFLALLLTVLCVALAWLASGGPLLQTIASLLRRLHPTDDPFADAAAFGPLGMLIVHAIIARAERPARRTALVAAPMIVRREKTSGPIVLVQCESFFDARRLSPSIPDDLLPGLAAAVSRASAYGRLQVPGWGANTMRTEFAALSGLPESALGYDRFNPYYALARTPLESQVWRLRRAGYRTICLHPFDRRFFRRDLVMPALGFERFLCRETLGGPNRPPYCPDPELAGHILRVLDAEGPQTFIFAITMGNHGPWLPNGTPLDPAVAGIDGLNGIPGEGELRRYLHGLRGADEMLRILMDGLKNRGATLGFYGDHLPSLGATFEHFGFDEPHADYVVWPGIGEPQPRDLPAHELLRFIVDTALAAPAARCPAG
jgi:hypothetical protein